MARLFKQFCQSEYGDSPNNFHLSRLNNTLQVELTYPNVTKNGCTHISIDQESVRGSDGLRLHYDYDRDGWVIEQPLSLDIDDDGEYKWAEVHFIQSWAINTDSVKL